MQLRTGQQKQVINLNKVVVDKKPGEYSFDVKYETITAKGATPNSRLIFFILASTSVSLTNELMANNDLLLPYARREKEDISITIAAPTASRKRSTRSRKLEYVNKITVKQEQIRDLTLFVGAYTESFTRRGLRSSLTTSDSLMVFQNGEIPENNIVLFEDKEYTTVYLGRRFQDNSGTWYKQSFGPTLAEHRLYPQVVPNIKVSFKSSLEDSLFQTVGNSFKDLYSLNKGINSKQAIVNKLKTETRNYFSPLYMAKTGASALPLSFSFNKLDFFRNNGEFSRLIKNEQNLLDSFETVSIKILRKRVSHINPSSRLTGAPPSTKFKDQAVEVVTTNAKTLNLFGSQEIATIFASDPSIQQSTYGLYTYTAELTFIDNTHLKLSSIVGHPTIGLRKRHSDLSALYEESTMSNNCEGNGLSLSDSYASVYSSTSRKQLVIDSIKTYVSAISLFHKDLAHAVHASPGQLALKIYNLVDPLVNGPQGLKELIKLIQDLAKEVDFYATKSSGAPTGTDSYLRAKSSRLSSNRRLITISHSFKEGIDADDLRNDGYEYLTTGPTDNQFVAYNPFKYVSYAALAQITAVEKLKFPAFTQELITPLSLTPNVFNLQGRPIEVNSSLPTAEEQNAIVATTLLAANKYRNSPLDISQFNITDNTTDTSTNMLSILNNNLQTINKESCQVSILTNPDEGSIFGRYPSPPPRETSDYLDVADAMSEQSPMVINTSGSVSLSNFMLASINNSTAQEYYNNIKEINNHVLSYLVQTDYFAGTGELPQMTVKNITDKNIFKSRDQTISSFKTTTLEISKDNIGYGTAQINQLLLNQSPPIPPNPQQENYINALEQGPSGSEITEMAMKYGNIRNIEYLAGFTRLNDSLMMKNPLWVPLTHGLLENFDSSQKVLLCRLRENQTTLSEYRGTMAPLYNEFFILGPSQYSPPLSIQGAPIFEELPSTSFAALKTAANLNPDVLKYAIPINNNIKVNNPDYKHAALGINSPMNEQQQTENLFTNGGDFLLPNGDKYIGPYHLHYDKKLMKFVAMEGSQHVGTPHARLTPNSQKALRILSRNVAAPQAPAGTQPAGPTTTNGY